MTSQQILTKAIKKALSNDWVSSDGGMQDYMDRYELRPSLLAENLTRDRYQYLLIFDKDFAKALWGEAPIAFNAAQHPMLEDDGTESTFTAWHSSLPAWQYHLQQMVIAADPIKYLEENL